MAWGLMRRAPIIAIACLLATLLSSCNRRQRRQGVYPTSRPSNAAVAGKYAVAGDSEVIEQYGGKGTLDLYPDGTFVMRSMPKWNEEEHFRRGKLWAGRGRWSIRDVGPVASDVPRFRLTLRFEEIGGESTNYADHTVSLMGKTDPYDMHMYIWGSAGRMLILRKTAEPVLPTSGHLEKEAQGDN